MLILFQKSITKGSRWKRDVDRIRILKGIADSTALLGRLVGLNPTSVPEGFAHQGHLSASG